jgi:hypothetical protein
MFLRYDLDAFTSGGKYFTLPRYLAIMTPFGAGVARAECAL